MSVPEVDASEAQYRGPGTMPLLRMTLLGGFRVEHADALNVVSGWPRRSAKTLIKLLAAYPDHAMHREQIIEVLWPGAAVNSALNSFGKALHAARHALEPELARRQDSAYLRLTDGMLFLNTDHVRVDADRFEQLAEAALSRGDVTAYEVALAAYSGELLPEDLYASWCADRRSSLAELHIRLLLGAAESLEVRGAYDKAAGHLREILRQDPAREVAHQRLMRVYTGMGTPEQAIRQFQLCEDVLQRELGLPPQRETVSLYHDILASRLPGQTSMRGPDSAPAGPRGPRPGAAAGGVNPGGPFVGRQRAVQRLADQLARHDDGRSGMVVITGETGVGKTRLLEEFAAEAAGEGALVLWGGRGAHANQFACGPFAVALEGYADGRTEPERRGLAHCYPALTRFVPSLGLAGDVPATTADLRTYHAELIATIVRLLTDLARTRPVLIALGDLHGADPVSLDLVRYLAHLAMRRPLLMVGAVRDEELAADIGLRQMVEAMTRARVCLRIDLCCLSRRSCDQYVQAALGPDHISGELLEQIYLRSRGNPLFIGEIVREIGAYGAAARTSAGAREGLAVAESAPARARARMATRLASMDETLRRVLGLAAAAGETEISLSNLRTGAAALDPPVAGAALFDALDRALQMRLLEERSAGYAFRHPFVRSALFGCLPRHRRDEFQAAITAPLAAAGIRPDTLAGIGARRPRSAGSRREEHWNARRPC